LPVLGNTLYLSVSERKHSEIWRNGDDFSMGKSIRSKIKRKHRAEFRATIGNEAYQANMKKVQARLKESLERQSLNSLERLSSALGTEPGQESERMEEDEPLPAIDAGETAGTTLNKEVRGENKVIVSKRSKRKQKHSYRMKGMERKQRVEAEGEKPKKRPRFFCSF
jgi:hypothetical protein